MNLKDRIIQFIGYKGLSIQAFEYKANLSNGAVSKMGDGTRRSTLDKISNTFPELNTNWLLTGEGEMLKEDDAKRERGIIRYHENLEASAGNVGMFDDGREGDGPVMRIPGFEDCTDAINVWGDSMYPVLKSGEIVILREWKESFVDYGKIYLVVTRNGNRMIKYLKPSEKEGMVRCVSENPDHPPFDVPMEDIARLFLVKGHIEKCAI